MFNITSKYFSFFNSKLPARWLVHITRDFLACYSCSYYSSMVSFINFRYFLFISFIIFGLEYVFGCWEEIVRAWQLLRLASGKRWLTCQNQIKIFSKLVIIWYVLCRNLRYLVEVWSRVFLKKHICHTLSHIYIKNHLNIFQGGLFCG